MSIVITKETIQRLVSDVKNIKKDPLEKEGIFYQHDEIDMLKGYAMIVGPEDTPYFGGYYLFEFHFPTNYPFEPPLVFYETNNGITRFHPNLYKCGKVCLSILNTWQGEPWSSIQTIRSVLLTLLSILTNNPLCHEPGVSETNRDIQNYNEIITFANIESAIGEIITKKILKCQFEIFYEKIIQIFQSNREKIYDIIKKKKELFPSPVILRTYAYHLNQKIDYEELEKKIFLL